MTRIRQFTKRSSLLVVALSLFGAWVLGDVVLFTQKASAAQIANRSLTLSSSANGSIADGNPGEGGNGAQATHTFDFTEGSSSATVGSIEFLYCTTPLPGTTCTAPAGLDASTVVSVGGTTAAGWSLGTGGDAPTANNIRITRTAGDITDTQNLIFGDGSTGTDYIQNPTADNEEFFVRITTYSDAAWTGGNEVDQGTVASAVAQQIDITARVQETLNFSVGAPEDDPANVADPTISCNPFSDDGALDLGDADGVLSFQQAYDAYSYFRVSTNANNGTAIYYSGDTLQFGTNDIGAIGSTEAASSVGSEQFGLAVDTTVANAFANTLNSVQPTSTPTDYSNGGGTITDGGTATFAFDTGSVASPVQLASSAGAGTKTITCDTATVRYIGNVSTTTPPGVYTTTITFIAAPEY